MSNKTIKQLSTEHTSADLADRLVMQKDVDSVTGQIQVQNVLARYRDTPNSVESGLLWTQDTGLVGDMTSGVIVIDRYTVDVNQVDGYTFTASKDTYIDVDDAGDLTYTEVTNNATAPSLAADSIRIAIVVTDGTDITWVNQANNHTYSAYPRATVMGYSQSDSAGYRIYPTASNAHLIAGNCRIAQTTSGVSGSIVGYNGLEALAYICKPNTNYVLQYTDDVVTGWAGTGYIKVHIYDDATANARSNKIGEYYHPSITNVNTSISHEVRFNSGTNSGLRYINFGFTSANVTGTGTMYTNADRTGRTILREE